MTTVTVFHDVFASQKEEHQLDYDGLSKLIAQPSLYDSKAAMPLLKLARFGDTPNDKKSLRYDGNIVSVSGAEVDYDLGGLTMEGAAEKLRARGVCAVLYETPSATPDQPRWRILLPFSRDYTEGMKEQRDMALMRVESVLGDSVARESFTLSQSFYFGGIIGKQYRYQLVGGDCIDTVDIPIVQEAKPKPAPIRNFISTSSNEVLQILSYIHADCGYREWLDVGMGLHEKYGGSDEGLAIWDNWSAGGSKYRPGECQRKWRGFGGSGISFGTVAKMAQQYGADLSLIAKDNKSPKDVGGGMPDSAPPSIEQPESGASDEGHLSFTQFVVTEKSEDMKKKMLNDTFIFSHMAIMGQSTVFYGGPNVGKTLIGLKLLIEGIQRGDFDAARVFYINADDTYKGVVLKQGLAEEYGFNMLVPGHNGFKAEMVIEILRGMSVSGAAKGSIVLLDNLKKFTDLMSKSMGSAFGDVQRNYVMAGGSAIGYAHVNKAKGDEGESIHAGTTDIIDDGDCAYIIDELEDDGLHKTVQYKNKKDRGDVYQVVNFRYKSKKNNPSVSYLELLYSVEMIDDDTARQAGERAAIANLLEANDDYIKAVLEAIRNEVSLKTELIGVLADKGLSKPRANKVLDMHTGTNKVKGHRWNYRVEARNAHRFFSL